MSLPRSVYIHVPFCRHRCGYCDFTLVAGRDDLIGDYLSALKRELQSIDKPIEVDTMFLGGGTPTHLPNERLCELIGVLRSRFSLAPGYEWSIEANPRDLLDADKLTSLAGSGINRISLGVQSFNSSELSILERDHDGGIVREVTAAIRESIPNVALDLIFGVPGQTLTDWKSTLDEAVQLRPRHLSTYGLTFEKGTSFWTRRAKGTLSPVPEELEREMYAHAIGQLTEAGYRHYEISNFAQPGFECRHNLGYWNAKPYLAFGPGAASYIDGVRRSNHRSVFTWLKRMESGHSPVAEEERLKPEQAARELIMLGLRMVDGLDLDEFRGRTGFDLIELGGATLQHQLREQLLEQRGSRIRLTNAGRFVADSVVSDLL
ncbi:radical SAM family heme chaperone HemW [Stratiformator vulcanicus]|uniref:radical SAM family heme chaperone HemW n=1 Tax=Stratiformator vulcanicus TaxID=2527980 RepID=UPI002877D97F|nr:radical SAM family heme chaperone HemW [Stratiformator vulcanicus]